MELNPKASGEAEFVFFAWAGSVILALIMTVMLPVTFIISYLVKK